MANVNDFLPYATSTIANVQSQSEYIINAQRPVGFQEGTTAYSANFNKALRQAGVVQSQVAQYISDTLGQDVLDNADFPTLLAQIGTALAKWTGATDSTISKAGNVLGVAAGSLTNPYLAASAVTTASIAAGAVTPAKRVTKMAIGGSGAVLNSTTTFVTGADSNKISLVGGRPVLVMLQCGTVTTFPATQVASFITAPDNPSSALSVAFVRRDPNNVIADVQIAAQTVDTFTANFSVNPPWQYGVAQLKCIDRNPPAGTWIYAVLFRKTTTAHPGSVGWNNTQVVAFEF